MCSSILVKEIFFEERIYFRGAKDIDYNSVYIKGRFYNLNISISNKYVIFGY